VEITPKYWNYDSLLCNTAPGKEVIRTMEMIVSSTSSPTISRDNHPKHDPSPVSTINEDTPKTGGVLLTEKREETTITICEHKEKSFG
jgi:hypothetical protein